MNRKTINIIYICLTFAAIGCILTFFFTWNSISSVKNQLQGDDLKHFSIDKCEINKNQIYIVGWAFIPNQDHSFTRVYAERQDNKLLPISSNYVVRGDVYKKYGKDKMYKFAGFQASKRLIDQEKLIKKIFIVTQSEKNQSYVAQYICK